MNKIERVRAALAGAEVDRVPASFWFHFRPDRIHGEASVKAHLDYYRASGIDFLKVMDEHHYESDVAIRTPSDWRKITPGPSIPRFQNAQLDEVKRIVDQLQGDCLVITTVFGPFAAGNHAAKRKVVTEHLKEDPESVSAGLAAIAENLARYAEACIDAGASGIFYSAQGGEADRFTEEEFLDHIKPHDLTVLSAVRNRGEFNLLHVCKDNVRLPFYEDYPAHAVNWAAAKNNPSLVEGRAIFNRAIVGGLHDRGVIVDGEPDDIQSAARKVISQFGRTGLILGADCTLPTDIPVENIRIAVEATGM